MQTQTFKLKILLSGMWDLRGHTLIVHCLHISFYFFSMCVCVCVFVLQTKSSTYPVLCLECVILQSGSQFLVKMTDHDSVPVLCKDDKVS